MSDFTGKYIATGPTSPHLEAFAGNRVINFNGISFVEPFFPNDRFKTFLTEDNMTTIEDADFEYKYRPEYLSIRLYNTPIYWSLLLDINKCMSHKDFNKSSYNILDTTVMRSYNKLKTHYYDINKDRSYDWVDLTIKDL